LTPTLRFPRPAAIVLTSALLSPLACGDVLAGDGIELAVTLGTDTSAGACGSATHLEVDAGTQVNFCYVVTNDSALALNDHTLADDVSGPLVSSLAYPLAPAARYQYNRIISATASQSPTSTWTAYGNLPTYSMDDTVTPAFIDITASGTPLDLYQFGQAGVTLDFPFVFYGALSNQITISNAGGILFGTELGDLSPFTEALPAANLGPAILPYWTNFSDSSGNVYFQSIGSAPNRQFVVEWYDRPHSGLQGGPDTTAGATFELVLSEGSNQILFNYQTAGFDDARFDDGLTATVGLNDDADHATQYSCDQASLHDGLAIQFTPVYDAVYSAAQKVSLDVGTASETVSPATLSATVVAGATATQTVTIRNGGNRDLAWHFGAAPARANFPASPRITQPLGDPDQKRPERSALLPTSAPARHPSTKRGDAVPAFGFDEVNGVYVSLDPNAPQTTSTLGPGPDASVLAGDFIGYDFSVEYALDLVNSVLYAIGTQNASTSVIAHVPPGIDGYNWSALRWDPSTGTTYLMLVGPLRQSPITHWHSKLYSLDLTSGATTLIGDVAPSSQSVLITDIAISEDGSIYGLDLESDALMAIDKSSGAGATIGSIGYDANNAQSMDFDDASGTLYLAGCVNDPQVGHCTRANMYTVDTASGLATPIAPIGTQASGTEIGALAIATIGGCSPPSALSWLSFAPASGSTAPDASDAVVATFDASGLAPGTYRGTACLFSNDPTQRRRMLPVSLQVSANTDRIFADGFDP